MPRLSKVDLVSLGGKNEVLNALAWFRDRGGNPSNLFGLVDRDECVTGRLKTSHLSALQNQPPLAGSSIDRFNKSRWLSWCRISCFLWPIAMACPLRQGRTSKSRVSYSITLYPGSCFLVLNRVRPGGRIGWF